MSEIIADPRFIIFWVTLIVTIVTANVGGGGLATIPVLVLLGLPPSVAIATNRLGRLPERIAIVQYYRARKIDWHVVAWTIAPAVVGSLIGSLAVVRIDQELFQYIIACLTLPSLPVLLLKRSLGVEPFKPSRLRFRCGVGLMLLGGMLSGLFAATGVWMTYIFLMFGLTMLQIAGTRMVVSAAMQVTSAIVFIYAGLVNWSMAIPMAVAAAIGGWIGASLGLRAGDAWVKTLFGVVVLASTVWMLVGIV